MATFTDLVGGLAEQKRKARLRGTPITEAEVRGTTAGYFDVASDRLARAKALSQQKELAGAQITSTENLQAERLQAEAQRQAEALAEQKRSEQERIRVQEANLAEQTRQANMEMEVAQEAQESQQRQSSLMGGALGAYGGFVGGSAVGAAGAAGGGALGGMGGLAGAGSVLGPVGAIIGAGLGVFLSKKGCIIISACTDPNSYEVNVSRIFRDKYLGPETLAGYYALASKLAPLIDKYATLRWTVRTVLVKRLVDYGEWIFGFKTAMEKPFSEAISKGFLRLCGEIGRRLIHGK